MCEVRQHCMGRTEKILLKEAGISWGVEGTSNGAGAHLCVRMHEVNASFAVNDDIKEEKQQDPSFGLLLRVKGQVRTWLLVFHKGRETLRWYHLFHG